MATLSDLLGIEHYTCSAGGTVRKDFMVAVGRALGLDVTMATRKDDVTRAVWECAQRREMPENRLSSGTTVTNRVLREVYDGISRYGVPGRPPLPAPTLQMTLPTEADHDEEEEFDPSTLSDERDRRLREVAEREAKDAWRDMVLDAYGQRCAITGADSPMALDAAHIAPYLGPKSNVIANGLCLRTDLHRLFDRGALAIDERTNAVLIKPTVEVSTYGRELTGAVFTPPNERKNRPSKAVLRAHRLWCGFTD